MDRGSRRGGVFVKLLIGLGVLIVLGGAGFGVYWIISAVDRHEWDYLSGYGDRHAEAVDVMLAHAGSEKVQYLAHKRFRELADRRTFYPVEPKDLELFDKVFSVQTPPVDFFAEPAVRFSFRGNYPRARSWIKLPDGDPAVKSAVKAELSDVAGYPYGWEAKLEELDAYVATLVAFLKKQGVTLDDPDVRNALIGCWLRYDVSSAAALVKKLEGKKELGEGVAAFAVQWAKVSSPAKERTADLMHILARLKPEPTDELVAAVARFGSTPESAEPFRAWGPAATEKLTKVRDAMSSDWDRDQANKLLARLGGIKLTAKDIGDSIRLLINYRDSPPFRYQPGPDDPLHVPYFSPKDYGNGVEGGIPHKVKELAELGPAAVPGMVDLWKFYPDALEAHVVSKALAESAPEALAEALAKALDDFQPVAREVLEANRLPKNIKSPMAAYLWRKMTPAMSEGLSALCKLEKPPDAVAACLWRAVSCPEASFSTPATSSLKEKLPPDLFVRGLFLNLNQKSSYDVAEVDHMISMVTEKQGSGAPLARTMGTLVDAAGKPEAVPMIQKVVGLKALARVGDAGAKPVLERYAKDTSGYVDITFKVDSKGRRSNEVRTNRLFADLAKAALDAIR